MAITHFIPTFWETNLAVALRKRLVYAGPGIVNRNYEGTIKKAGDTVTVTSIGDPTIADYVPNVTVITPEELTDAQRTMKIDQAKYFAFKVEDIEQAQAAGAVMPEAISRAGYKLALTVDSYVASLYTQANTANVLTAVTSFGSTNAEKAERAYQVLVDLKTRMGETDIPDEGRYVIVPEWFHSLLLHSPLFVSAEKYGSNTVLMNGEVGRALNFTILKSNNVPQPVANSTFVLSAGTNMAISFAEQINKTEAYRPESSFSDAVKGLALYGAKVMRPEALFTVTCTRPS